VRSSSGRVRASGRRCRCVAASLIALVALGACGDNVTPRLAPARFVYDDGTEQIDRHQLYDRELGVLCTVSRFSDGYLYCLPDADRGFYTDRTCTTPVGVAPAGAPIKEFVVTAYVHLDMPLQQPSRVFRSGGKRERPTELWQKVGDVGCVVENNMPSAEYDYYDASPVVVGAVGIEPWFTVGEYVVDAWRSEGLLVPAEIEKCNLDEVANGVSTRCIPLNPPPGYADAACTQPMAFPGLSPSYKTYRRDPLTDCMSFYARGDDVEVTRWYVFGDTGCVENTWSSGLPMLRNMLVPIPEPTIARVPTGNGRVQLVRLDHLPLHDDLVRDTQLGTDCRRLDDGRCVPATNAKVESWFADAACATPVDVAMVRTGGCNAPMPYAEREGLFYPVKDAYAAQLYQLSTGDTCQIYNPPAPFVAHSIGPALGEDAFARATLMIE
jgi:hypothetical protein